MKYDEFRGQSPLCVLRQTRVDNASWPNRGLWLRRTASGRKWVSAGTVRAGGATAWCVGGSVGLMGDPIRFDDIPPDEKILFLNSARQHHPDVELTPVSDEPGSRTSSRWVCLQCGEGFPIDDVLVAEGEPRCPRCGASGWEVVHPPRLPNGHIPKVNRRGAVCQWGRGPCWSMSSRALFSLGPGRWDDLPAGMLRTSVPGHPVDRSPET